VVFVLIESAAGTRKDQYLRPCVAKAQQFHVASQIF
jgi:hypothetical protein